MRYQTHNIVLILLLYTITFQGILPDKTTSSDTKRSKTKIKNKDTCYCQLSGKKIHDTNCLCDVDHLIEYNNNNIYPLIRKLIVTDFFRFYKTNANRGCSFWKEAFICASNQCSLEPCLEDELPEVFRKENEKLNQNNNDSEKSTETSSKHKKEEGKEKCSDNVIKLSKLEKARNEQDHEDSLDLLALNSELNEDELDILSEKGMTIDQLVDMHQHWDSHDREQAIKSEVKSKHIWERDFCSMDPETDKNLIYYDLLVNPERYTGYKGHQAHKIWEKIYAENCYDEAVSKKLLPNGFKNDLKNSEQDKLNFNFFKDPKDVLNDLTCLEKRVFYRAVSGIHASVSLHLTYNWWFPEFENFQPNLNEFERRFENPNGEQYIHNFYFVWLLELRALAKSMPYIINPSDIRSILHTGDVLGDIKTQSLVIELLEVIKNFDMHFDESNLFRGTNALQMMEEFRQRMYNVSLIVDCCDCEKCRLWGKLQVVGLATAVRILLTPNDCIEKNFSIVEDESNNKSSNKEIKECDNFKMSRSEIVALFNGFARLSHSIKFLEDFKTMLPNL